MTYPEEAIAAAIRSAVSGRIPAAPEPGLANIGSQPSAVAETGATAEPGANNRPPRLAVQVYTDADADQEWRGQPKIYVLRGALTLIGDVTAGGDSGFGSSEITVTVLAANKAESAALFAEVETALLAALESGIGGVASWRVTGKDAFARFADGSFQDEYYHAIKLTVYHLT